MRGTCIIILLLLAIEATAQNLVPNPGFEVYNDCPQARGMIYYSEDYSHFPTAASWVSALWNTTPDYYNRCATNPLVTLPYNTYNDYQQPRGGDACAGISMLSGWPATPHVSDYREYLETRLSAPLEAGKNYFVSFFVNMTYHLPGSANQIVVDLVGARLTDTQINIAYPFGQPELSIPGPPDVVNPRHTFITDTAKWEQVKGVYKAHGGEQWLTVGYFKDSLPLNYRVIYTTYPGFPDSIHSTCYMYVDDVCVTEIPPPAHDTVFVQAFPATITSAVTGAAYAWSTGDSVREITVTSGGMYWVTATGDCSFRSDTITVVCLVDSSELSHIITVSSFPVLLSASQAGGTHLWSTGAGASSVWVDAPGTYWVESYSNCKYVLDSFVVLCEADVHFDTLVHASSFPMQLSTPLAGDSLLWAHGDTLAYTNILKPGTYTVTVWRGCQRYIYEIEVVYRSWDDCIWLPSAFTPNGDGINDAFGPVFSCYALPLSYNFRIYNRFGECVFDTEDIGSKWDGTFRGAMQDIGAYYYMLRYSGGNHKDDQGTLLKGDLTLIR